MDSPLGSLSLSLQYAKQMLAASATFRTLVGAADQAEAEAKIYLEGLPEPADNADVYSESELAAYRPYAIVWGDESGGLAKRRIGAAAWEDSGRTVLLIGQAAPDVDRADGDRSWANTVGQIVDELCDLVDTDGGAKRYLVFNVLQIEQGPGRWHPDYAAGEGEEQFVVITLEW